MQDRTVVSASNATEPESIAKGRVHQRSDEPVPRPADRRQRPPRRPRVERPRHEHRPLSSWGRHRRNRGALVGTAWTSAILRSTDHRYTPSRTLASERSGWPREPLSSESVSRYPACARERIHQRVTDVNEPRTFSRSRRSDAVAAGCCCAGGSLHRTGRGHIPMLPAGRDLLFYSLFRRELCHAST